MKTYQYRKEISKIKRLITNLVKFDNSIEVTIDNENIEFNYSICKFIITKTYIEYNNRNLFITNNNYNFKIPIDEKIYNQFYKLLLRTHITSLNTMIDTVYNNIVCTSDSKRQILLSDLLIENQSSLIDSLLK